MQALADRRFKMPSFEDKILVTNDENDFAGILGLTVENWTGSPTDGPSSR